MAGPIIPQRELRNNVGEILRRAESGTEFTITVRGRPVARLGPVTSRPAPRVDVDAATLKSRIEATPVDDGLGDDLAALRAAELPVE